MKEENVAPRTEASLLRHYGVLFELAALAEMLGNDALYWKFDALIRETAGELDALRAEATHHG